MAGPSDPNSYGFFGRGYWGRKVFWEKVPAEHRNLDTDGYLEGLMRSWGDECESFLRQIENLPKQREPYDVRAREGEEEWFYFTEAFSYDDAEWGSVVRLVGEKLYADMPNHDEDDVPTTDEDELETWWGWWPYAPISSVARWWDCTWDDVKYEVVRVRTRSFDWTDTPYIASSSQANEVWLRGGDLQIFFDYFSDGVPWRDNWTSLGTGDGTASPDVEFSFTPVRIEYNDTASPTPWLVDNAKLRVLVDLTTNGERFRLYDVPDGSVDETGNLYPQGVSSSNSGVTIQFSISGSTVTLTDSSGPFSSSDVGEEIRVHGTASNNGVFSVLSATANTVTYKNENGANEAGAASNAWEMGTGQIVTTTSYGTINYQTGQIALDIPVAAGTAVVDSSIDAKWYVRGYYVPFYPPRIIDRLARDFAFENDHNDPESTQRSTIANLTKYYGLKSTEDSYRIRGEISLFDIVTKSLWSVDSVSLWSSLPFLNKFKHRGGMYTDLIPRRLRFDDIAGDEMFWDPDTSAWVTLMDNTFMYQDASADGFSIALGYGIDVTQGYYGYVSPSPHPSSAVERDPAGLVSIVELSSTEASSYGIIAGYRATLRMMRCQYEAFNWRKGPFGLTEYDKAALTPDPPAFSDQIYWIDAVDSDFVLTGVGAAWQATTAYLVGDIVFSTSAHNAYRCTVAGTTGGVEPTWNTTGSTTTTDGSVTWVRVPEDDVGEWDVILGVGIDSSGSTLPGPAVGHADIVGVNTVTKEFTISGDHTGTIIAGDTVNVMRSTGNDNPFGTYLVLTVTLVAGDTVVAVAQPIPSAIADGEMGWTDIAVRYYPEVDITSCGYCKSYKIRAEIEPTDEAYEFYDTDAKLDAAIERIIDKIDPKRIPGVSRLRTTLVPVHARIVDWAVIKRYDLENVSGGNTIQELIGTEYDGLFYSKKLSDISGVDQVAQQFTINGDQRNILYDGQEFSIRGSTGNDGEYTIAGIDSALDANGDTVVDVGVIPSSIADGAVYPCPIQILMTVQQRGNMSGGQTQTARLYDDAGAVKKTYTQSTNVDLSTDSSWHSMVENEDVTSDVKNNAPVKIDATDNGPITAGEVRFTFTVSKYLR